MSYNIYIFQFDFYSFPTTLQFVSLCPLRDSREKKYQHFFPLFFKTILRAFEKSPYLLHFHLRQHIPFLIFFSNFSFLYRCLLALRSCFEALMHYTVSLDVSSSGNTKKQLLLVQPTSNGRFTVIPQEQEGEGLIPTNIFSTFDRPVKP